MADFDRFRSFAERYVVERAGSFRTGFEQEDAFAAVLDAKGIYNNIAAQAKYMDQPEQGDTTQGAVGQQMARNSAKAYQNQPSPYANARIPPRAVQAQKQAWAQVVRNILNNYGGTKHEP